MARNCWIISDDGWKNVHATYLNTGMSIIADEAKSSRGRTFHPWKRTSSSFTMEVTHPSYSEYREFNEWLVSYMDRILSGDFSLGPFRVIIPSRRFDKTVIIESGITFGRKWDDFIWRQRLEFAGASTPVDLTDDPLNILSYGSAATYYTTETESGDYPSAFAIAEHGDAVTARWNTDRNLYDGQTNLPDHLTGYR